jgi:hypothetical protein
VKMMSILPSPRHGKANLDMVILNLMSEECRTLENVILSQCEGWSSPRWASTPWCPPLEGLHTCADCWRVSQKLVDQGKGQMTHRDNSVLGILTVMSDRQGCVEKWDIIIWLWLSDTGTFFILKAITKLNKMEKASHFSTLKTDKRYVTIWEISMHGKMLNFG